MRARSWKAIPTVLLLALLGACSLIDGDGNENTEAFSRFLSYQTKTDLVLPFEGEWYVVAGGRTLEHNHHAWSREQRFAMDIVQQVDGRSFSGDGKVNEDYYCFGQSIYAPGDGIVVAVENGALDNPVPNVTPNHEGIRGLGNYLVIDHRNGEYSFLVHFQHGTIVVHVGDVVVQGQVLGKIGSSGNSTEPHLHYHMQTTADILDGEGLPTQFQDYYANGVLVDRGELTHDEYVRRHHDVMSGAP